MAGRHPQTGPAAEPPIEFQKPRGIAALWFAVLAGPLAWVLAFGLQYGFVKAACGTGNTLVLHLATVVALVVVAAGMGVAWHQWQRAGRAWPGEGGSALARARFMAVLGLLAGLLFTFAILAQWLAILFLHPCMAI